jgi:hypothetical protein
VYNILLHKKKRFHSSGVLAGTCVMHNNKSVDNLSKVRGLLIFFFWKILNLFIYLYLYFFVKIATHVVVAA